MFNSLTPYKYVIDVVVALVIGIIAVTAVHKYNSYQQGIGETRVRAEWTRDKAARLEAAIAIRSTQQGKVDDATSKANEAKIAAATAIAAIDRVSGMLDSTTRAIYERSGAATIDANRKYIATLGELLATCKTEYRSMGEEAEGHARDSLMYQRAWPSLPATTQTR